MRRMECHSCWFLLNVFRSEKRENRQVSITEEESVCPLNVSGDELVTSGSCCPGPPSHIAFIDMFSAMAISVGALSYSAISQTPPPPQPPNPIHIILQSSSSCSPGVSIFHFPSSPPPLPCPPALSIFSNTLPTVQPVSLRFFFFFFIFCLYSLTRSGQSFSSLTRSKPQPCSELLKVRKWRCNVIEWSGNRIYEGWV